MCWFFWRINIMKPLLFPLVRSRVSLIRNSDITRRLILVAFYFEPASQVTIWVQDLKLRIMCRTPMQKYDSLHHKYLRWQQLLVMINMTLLFSLLRNVYCRMKGTGRCTTVEYTRQPLQLKMMVLWWATEFFAGFLLWTSLFFRITEVLQGFPSVGKCSQGH